MNKSGIVFGGICLALFMLASCSERWEVTEELILEQQEETSDKKQVVFTVDAFTMEGEAFTRAFSEGNESSPSADSDNPSSGSNNLSAGSNNPSSGSNTPSAGSNNLLAGSDNLSAGSNNLSAAADGALLAGTKTYCDPGNNYSITWAEGDVIGIFPREGYQEPFAIPADQVGNATASFDGGYWALKEGLTYNAYYPFDVENFESAEKKTSIAVSYIGQSQTGTQCNAGAFDYTYSDWTTATGGTVSFSFHHIGAFLVLSLELPATATYTALTLEADGKVLPTAGTYDLTAAKPAFTANADALASFLSMELKDFTADAKSTAVFYMMLPPCDLSTVAMTVRLTTSAGTSCTYTLASKKIEASKLYKLAGTPKSSGIAGSVDGWTIESSHEYVDLGLTSGTLWATCNVGAEKPEDYGDYFAWGETAGYNSGKTKFDSSTYKWCNGPYNTLTKYCTSSNYGTVDNKTELELEDDAARVNWGGSWRMPSSTQIDELKSECNTEWTTQGSVYGCKVTSKKNGNSIFLPAAGYRGASSLFDADSGGHYWSRSLYESTSYGACSLYFNSNNFSRDYFGRYCGQSVRPVYQAEINVESVKLDESTLTLSEGESATLSATVLPDNATDKTIVWTSSAPAVATVIDGIVTYIAEGACTITATSAYNPSATATCEVTCKTKSYELNGHEYVDLGLTSGTLWATCNVGAEEPEGYGDRFAWGETTGKNYLNFFWSTYIWCDSSQFTMTKYCISIYYGSVDNKTELDLADDAAYVNWGAGWRMPSIVQIHELISECNTEWTTQGGVYGRKVTSKKNGNSIFLPAAGYRDGYSSNSAGSYGCYWSRSLYESDSAHAYYLLFSSSNIRRNYDNRYCGQSVRPVVSE